MSKKLEPDFGEAAGPALHAANWRFGEFELDETKRELRKGGELLVIEPKPLNLLMLMLRHPGELITKNDLIEALWTGRIVTEAVLGTCVAKLRSVLGPGAAEWIKNVHGYGYRFDAKVELLADRDAGSAAPKLTLQVGETIPQRPNWQLVRRLGRTGDSWLAEHVKTRVRRVFKFTTEPQGLSALKREVTIFRLLRESLGDKVCYVELLDWNFDEPPYFVEAEYCTGGSLEEWFNAQGGVAKVPLATRLDLIAQIADALADVHVIGVLHKDLKPANIFVVPNEGGIPKIRLADFGSGRLLDADRLAALEITRMGFTQVIDVNNDSTSGTPLYLAPEVLAGHPATVKADIYALGVILYQCVVGNLRRPLSAGWEQEVEDEMLREDIAAASNGNSERRLADSSELARRLRSTEQRRRIRAEERETLARAEARARAADRARARRLGITVAFAAMAVGLVVSTLLYVDARASRNRALAETARSEKVAAFLSKDMFSAVSTEDHPVRDLTVKQLLDSAASQVPNRFADEPDIAARVYESLGRGYNALEALPEARRLLDRALTLYEQIEPGCAESLRIATEAVLLDFVNGALDAVRIQYYSRIAEEAERRYGAQDLRGLQVRVAIARGRIRLGEWQRGAAELQAAFDRLSSAGPAADFELLNVTEMALAFVRLDLAQFPEAELRLRSVLERVESGKQPRHRDVARIRQKLGTLYAYTGRFSESAHELDRAGEIFREWFANDTGHVLSVELARGLLKFESGDPEASASILEATLVKYSGSIGAELDQSYVQRIPLAQSLLAMGRLTDAETMVRNALLLSRSALGDMHPYTLSAKITLADIQQTQGHAEDAMATLASTRLGLSALPQVHPLQAEAERIEGQALVRLGRPDSGLAALEQSQQQIVQLFGTQHRRAVRLAEAIAELRAVVNPVMAKNTSPRIPQ